MDFVGSNAWFTVLLIVHVFGAIAGIGPTFAYGLMGKSAQAAGPNGGVAIMEVMAKIDKFMVNPVYFVAQPLTGALLIFNRGIDRNFWQQEWLIVGIGAYIVIGVLAYAVNNPAFHRMIQLAKEGQAMSEEFGGHARKVQALGPVFMLLATTLVLMMIWKPGAEDCVTALLRC